MFKKYSCQSNIILPRNAPDLPQLPQNCPKNKKVKKNNSKQNNKKNPQNIDDEFEENDENNLVDKNNFVNLNNLTDKNNLNELNDENSKIFSCELCNKVFKRKYHLNRHINENRCKIIKAKIEEENKVDEVESNTIKDTEELNEILKNYDVDEQTKIILNVLFKQNKDLIKLNNKLTSKCDNLENELNKLKNKTNKSIKSTKSTGSTGPTSSVNTINNINNVNNTINNTINNQNIILAHGSEDISNIDLKIVMEHLATLDFKSIVPNMTKHIYLNDSKPENKNFCVMDLTRNKCTYNDGKKWLVGKTDDKIIKIFDKVNNILTEPFDKDKLNKTIQFIQSNKQFREKSDTIKYSKNYLLSLWDENDKENLENKSEIIDELKHIFFNNKDAILKIKLNN
jgi:hypothetical protein